MTRARLLVLLPLLGAGCRFDATVPASTSVRCVRNADCPADQLCQTAVGRCVWANRGDVEAPRLIAASVQPALARRGAAVRVSLEVSEALSAPPKLRWVEPTREVEREATWLDERHAELVYVSDAEDVEGAVRVEATLVDQAGNVAAGLYVGAATLDFTPPSVLAQTVELRLSPPATSPTAAVTALATGGLARLVFSVSEPLAGPPTVETGGLPLAVSAKSATPTAFVFELACTAQSRDGTVALQARAEDLAGNAALLPLTTLQVDSAPPQPLDTTADAGIELLRRPWPQDPLAPRAEVRGVAGSAEPGARVLVLDAPRPDGVVIGTTTAGSDGAFAVPLGRDRTQVFLATVDAAGNESAARPVARVRWLATLAGKVPRSAAENPHVFLQRLGFQRAGLAPLDEEPADVAKLAAADGDAVELRSALAWRPATAPPALPARQGLASTYDPLGERLLWFGGAALGDVYGDPGRFDPEHDGNPAPRTSAALAFDVGRARGVLFGGLATNGGTDFQADTWEWNGASWALRASAGPAARTSHVMSYDPVRGAVLLAFGRGDAGLLGDLWEWDGLQWQQRTPLDPEGDGDPAPRRDALWVQAAARGASILVGGVGAAGVLGDTWEWSGTSWRRLSASGAPVGKLSGAYDAPSDTVVVLSSLDGGVRQTSAFRGGSWTTTTTGIAPQLGVYTAPSGKATVGAELTSYVNVFTQSVTLRHIAQSWEDGGWAPLLTHLDPLGPVAFTVDGALLARVPSGDIVADPTDGLGAWNGFGFQRRMTSALVGDRYGAVFDVARRQVIFSGGTDYVPDGTATGRPVPASHTVIWSVDDGGLRTLDGGVRPGPAWDPRLVYDSARGVAVQPGLASTCEWNGQSWAWKVDGGLPQRTGFAVAYDPRRGQTLVFGGTRTDGGPWTDLLAWDGQQLTELWTRTDGGPTGGDATGFYDAQRGLFLVQGAEWGWNGAAWERFGPTGAAGTRLLGKDERSGSIIGIAPGGLSSLDYGEPPVQLARFELTSLSTGGAQLDSLELTWRVAGRGELDGGVVDGVQLWAELDGTLVPLARGGGGATPADVVWRSPVDARLQRTLAASGGRLLVAVTPLGRPGVGPALLRSDTVSLEVAYRRP